MNRDSKSKYGQWAVVAGASEGLGAAFATALARRGHDLLLLARRRDVLTELGRDLEAKHRVTVHTLACDLADPRFADALQGASAGLDIGIAVYNAAYSFVGPLLDRPLEEALKVVDVNVRGPLRFVHALAPGMVERKRGAVVLMSSVAGFQGAPKLSAYAASKAFNIVLGESLWAELKPRGVDVVVSCAGAIRTPNYLRTSQKKEAPGTLSPEAVAETTLASLGSGPLVVPGAVNKIATFLLGRILTRGGVVSVMGKASSGLS